MAGGKDEKEKLAPIVIKRVKKGGHGHHGGAWKVAYADFVTAMMAFFLLLWLLNVTTEEQKNAISNYFDPSHPKISQVTNGSGGILGGMAMAPEGAMVTNVQPLVQPNTQDMTTRGIDQSKAQTTLDNGGSLADATEKQLQEELRKKEDERFKKAEEQLKAEIANSPELKNLAQNLIIDITPEGLRIQIVDDQGRSMFPSGSAKMFDFMRQLLLKVTKVVIPLPNQLSIRGHTDAQKYKDPSAYDNWNLSADRAQASRRVIVEGGLPETRVENVMGRADRENLLPNDPTNPRNRRITLILMRESLTPDKIAQYKKDKEASAKDAAAEAAAKASKPKEPAKGGLTIIDDTKPAAAPAGTGPAAATGTATGTAVPAPHNDDMPAPSTPLPTIETPASGYPRQPQVLNFNDGETPESDGLYQGPTQSPFTTEPQKDGAVIHQKGPPIINKKLFNLSDDKPIDTTRKTPNIVVMPAAPTAPAPAPSSTSQQKTIDFGDPVPAPTMPKAPAALPPAPDLQLDNKSVPSSPKVLDFGDLPSSSMPQNQTPTPTAPASKKELTF